MSNKGLIIKQHMSDIADSIRDNYLSEKNLLDISTLKNNYNLSISTYLPETQNGRVTTLEPINVTNYNKVCISFKGKVSDLQFLYSTFNGDTKIERTPYMSSGSVLNVQNATKLYLCFYSLNGAISLEDIDYIMVNEGTSPLPYEKRNWKPREMSNAIYDMVEDNRKQYGKYIPSVNFKNTEGYIENTAELPIELNGLNGNIEQETREGYNLWLNPPANTVNGVTLSLNNDGSFNLVGTCTAQVDFDIYELLTDSKIIKGQEYTLYCNIQNNYEIMIALHQDTTWRNTPITSTMNKKMASNIITYDTSTMNKFRYIIRAKKDITYNEKNIQPMLLKGTYTTTTLPPFEPYGSMPSINYPSEVKVTENTDVVVGNKNFIDFPNTTLTIGSANYISKTIKFEEKVLKKGKYNLSFKASVISGSFKNNAVKLQYNSKDIYVKYNTTAINNRNQYILDILEDITINNVQIQLYANSSGSIEISEIQLELGDAITSYVPHKEEQVLPLDLVNRNHIGEIAERGKFIPYSTGKPEPISNNDICITNFVDVRNLNYIYINFYYNNSLKGTGYCWYNENKELVQGGTRIPNVFGITDDNYEGILQGKFLVPKDAKYFRMTILESQYNKYQIAFSDLSYQPYTTPYNYTLGKITGTIDNWKVEKSWGKYTFTGNESLTLQNNNKRARFSLSNVKPVPNDSINEKIYCNILKSVSAGSTWLGVQGVSYDLVKDVIEISINSLTTLAQYQQALKGNYIIYQLNTPTTEQITNPVLIEQLNAIYRAKTYEGGTNISQNANVPIEIDMKAYLDIASAISNTNIEI